MEIINFEYDYLQCLEGLRIWDQPYFLERIFEQVSIFAESEMFVDFSSHDRSKITRKNPDHESSDFVILDLLM